MLRGSARRSRHSRILSCRNSASRLSSFFSRPTSMRRITLTNSATLTSYPRHETSARRTRSSEPCVASKSRYWNRCFRFKARDRLQQGEYSHSSRAIATAAATATRECRASKPERQTWLRHAEVASRTLHRTQASHVCLWGWKEGRSWTLASRDVIISFASSRCLKQVRENNEKVCHGKTI